MIVITVWKLQDFAITQILREIHFVEYGTAVLIHMNALNFANLVNYSLQKEQEIRKLKIQSLEMC